MDNNTPGAEPQEPIVLDSAKKKRGIRDLRPGKPQPETLRKLRAFACYEVFLAAAAIMIYYITTASRGEFHADCTDTILWANASRLSGRMFSESFNYACLLPFGGNLIMRPLVGIFGLTMKAHVIGMTVFFVLFAVFFGLMLHEMDFDVPQIFLTETFFFGLTLSSKKMREIFWGHIIYYSLGIIFLLIGMWLLLHFANIAQRGAALPGPDIKRRTLKIRCCVTFALLAVFVALTSTDGLSAMSIFTLPFFAAIVMTALADRRWKIISKSGGITLAVVVILGVAVIAGMALGRLWAGDVTAGYEEAYSNYSSIYEWHDHLMSLPHGWITLFGVQDMGGLPLASFEDTALLMQSVGNLLRLITSVLAAVFPVIATVFYGRYPDDRSGRAMRMWIWIHWAVSVIIIMGSVCGSLSGANWRLLPMAGTAIIVTALFIKWYAKGLFGPDKEETRSRVPALLAIPMILVMVINYADTVRMRGDSYKDNELYQIEEYLEEKNLTYGYATFWRANPITVISDDTIRVRSVNVNDDGTVTPYYYQSERSWFEDQPGQKEYFLLLDEGELNTLAAANSPLISTAADGESRTLPDGRTVYLLIFEDNPV